MSVKRPRSSKNDLDKAKLIQGKEIAEDKMDQNEDLAELRAGINRLKRQDCKKLCLNLGKEKGH